MAESSRLALIKRRLAVAREPSDPRARILANVEGPVSPALLAMLEQPGREASVLIAVVDRPRGPTMLFTERASHLKDHAGQISFPGGRVAAGESAIDAALREAEEEIGLAPQAVTVLGCLDLHLTGTGFTVTPVVGWVGRDFVARPDPLEVASVFEVPLDFVLDARNLQTTFRERLGTRLRTFEIHYGEQRIWGATATMLRTFMELLSDEKTK